MASSTSRNHRRADRILRYGSLSDELDEEAAARGEVDNSRIITNVDELLDVRELSKIPNVQINWELGDVPLAPTTKAFSSQGS